MNKRQYKDIECTICKKTYLSNYIHQHKKSTKHIEKANAIVLKESLLKPDLKQFITEAKELLNRVTQILEGL